jgi:DNA-binding Xre family transcriptional regulator
VNPVDEIQARLKGKNLSEVSRKAGVAYTTVFYLANGKSDDIYIRTYHKIKTALD